MYSNMHMKKASYSQSFKVTCSKTACPNNPPFNITQKNITIHSEQHEYMSEFSLKPISSFKNPNYNQADDAALMQLNRDTKRADLQD